MAWQSWSHGLMVAVTGGGCGSRGHIMEGSRATLCCSGYVAWWSWSWSHGLMMAVAGGGGGGGSRITEAVAVVLHRIVVAA